MNKKITLATTLSCLLGATAGYCATSGLIPFTFTSGTPIVASEVNSNFQSLATAINALSARVDKVEGKGLVAADLVGAYRVNGFQNLVDSLKGPEGYAKVGSNVAQGTLILNANGTGSISFKEIGFDLSIYGGGLTPGDSPVQGEHKAHNKPNGGSFSWHYANGAVNIQLSDQTITLAVTSGGKQLIATTTYSNSGTGSALGESGTSLLIMTRSS